MLRVRVGSVLQDPFGRIGAILTVGVIGFALVVPAIASDGATRINPARSLLSPQLPWSDGGPILGTDHLGRDLAVMTALGVRTSVLLGLSAVAVAAAIGWTFGCLCGFVGGRLDDFGGRVMDFFAAFPGLLLIIALSSVMGSAPWNVVVILAVATWYLFGRVARAAALSLRSRGFVDAAHVGGSSLGRILFTHVRPNTSGIVIGLVVIEIPRLILAEATLSFLGFGLDASQVSLGTLIASERDSLLINAWSVSFPGAVLTALSVGLSLLGLGIQRPGGAVSKF